MPRVPFTRWWNKTLHRDISRRSVRPMPYGLIGYPLGHSFSARYFADKFAREGIADCRYDLYELKTIEELPALLEEQPELRGFNVTIPYKQQIIPYLDDLSPETRMIGAVNCVRCEGRRLTGYNTDVTGLRVSL